MTDQAGSPAAEGRPSQLGPTWFPAEWFQGRGYLALSVAIGAALYIARRPQVVTHPEFYAEDGQTFFLGAYFGSPIESVLRSYQGYLHLAPRVLALLEHAVPIAIAPLLANVSAVLIAVGVAAYVASGRLSSAIPDRRLRLALGALVLFLPGAGELHGQMVYAQWFLGVFLVAAAVAPEPARWRGRAIEVGALAVAGLTGPAVVLIAPIHVVAAIIRRERWRVTTAAVTSAAALVQVIVLATTVREKSHHGSLFDAAGVVIRRALVEPILGARITSAALDTGQLAFPLASVIVLGLMVVGWRLPRWWLVALGYMWLASVAAALIGSLNTFATLLGTGGPGQRYFFFPGLVVDAAILVTLAYRRGFVPVLLAIALGVGIVADFPLPRRPTNDWATQSQCIGGPTPCLVPVDPVAGWTIHWPGPRGPYNQNRSYQP